MRIEENSGSDSTWYDQAGNPIGTFTAREKVVTQKYDALNHPTTRILPPDTTAQDNCAGACTNGADFIHGLFPYFPTVLPGGSTSSDLIIQGDTAAFTYDAAGRMLSAINHDAQVWRTYFANGALHTESDSIRSYDPADTISDVWGIYNWTLTYAYDLSGRRTSLSGPASQSYYYNALGLLDSTTASSVSHRFAYDAAGRLVGRATGTGVSESRSYDDDDRMTQRSNNVYVDNLGYDARGKVTSLSSAIVSDPGSRINSYSSDSEVMAYDGFGGLVLSTENRGSPTSDEYILDALGNVVQHDQNRQYWATGRESDTLYYLGPHLAETAAKPLPAYRGAGSSPLITTLSETYPSYDLAGNQTKSDTYVQGYSSSSFGVDFYNNIPGTGQSFTRSYYDAAERLRVSQRLYFFTDPGSNQRGRTSFQEYFYDALGRRIAMRSQRDSTCTDAGDPTPGWDCAQTMERFVWDGDQLLKELRDYGKWGDNAATLNGGGGSGNFFGSVTYTYALNLFGPDVPVLIASGNIGNIVPQASWRGTYEAGVWTDGSNVTSYNWPGQQSGLYLAPDARIATINANRWIGGLVEGKADAGGLVYDRNRYYDPSAGRFTQEDPAGLGGGANLYGYAGADPANNSDPFGLCTEATDGEQGGSGDSTKKSDAKTPKPVSCTYSQSTGVLACQNGAGDTFSYKGYSGAPGHVNKPQDQRLSFRGPIPVGTYRIDPISGKHNGMDYVLRLTGLPGTDTFGRGAFEIHGDSRTAPGTASEGCIVADKETRSKMTGGGTVTVKP